MSTPKKESLPKLAARHYLFWLADMACGIAGWVYGFGLEVQNWWALIGFMLVTRYIVFVSFGAADLARRRKESEESDK